MFRTMENWTFKFEPGCSAREERFLHSAETFKDLTHSISVGGQRLLHAWVQAMIVRRWKTESLR